MTMSYQFADGIGRDMTAKSAGEAIMVLPRHTSCSCHAITIVSISIIIVGFRQLGGIRACMVQARLSTYITVRPAHVHISNR